MINFNLLTKTQNQMGFIVETHPAMKILEEKNLKRKKMIGFYYYKLILKKTKQE